MSATPESALIASILLDPVWSFEAVDKAGLAPSHFRHSEPRQMFQKLLEMRDKGEPIDQSALAIELPELASQVWRVTDSTAAPAPEYYLGKIMEMSQRYDLGALAQSLAQVATNPEADLEATLDGALQTLSSLADKGFTTNSQTLREAAQSVLDDLDSPPSFIPTPWPALNECLGGLRPGALYVVAARPGIGKSLIALQLATAIATPSRQVAFISLEMDSQEIASRALSSSTGISLTKIDRRNLTEQEKKQIAEAYKELTNNLHLVATPSREIRQLRPTLRAIRAKGTLGAVFVDYLGLLDAPGNSLYEKVTAISKQLKSLAMELGVPIVALAQLNRKAEERSGAPSLADLRDSGAIEQDADSVLLLSNDEMQDLSLVVAKNRQGPLGSFTGKLDRSTMTLKALVKD